MYMFIFIYHICACISWGTTARKYTTWCCWSKEDSAMTQRQNMTQRAKSRDKKNRCCDITRRCCRSR